MPEYRKIKATHYDAPHAYPRRTDWWRITEVIIGAVIVAVVTFIMLVLAIVTGS